MKIGLTEDKSGFLTAFINTNDFTGHRTYQAIESKRSGCARGSASVWKTKSLVLAPGVSFSKTHTLAPQGCHVACPLLSPVGMGQMHK